MKNQDNMDDLKHIRTLMDRSTKFLTLSGFSGITAGIIALIGAGMAYFISEGRLRSLGEDTSVHIRIQMAILALVVLVCAVGAAWYFSLQKAKKTGTRLWTPAARRTLYHFLIPLITGGVFCISLVIHNNIHLLGPTMLIFYGLALINSAKFTVDEIHYLGVSEIVLGILSAFLLHYGLLFWALGFGVMHIIYGIKMHLKYDRK